MCFFSILQDDGDLPLHLLVRSGQATQVTVELLLRPIIQNPTICAYTGSTGVQLPLHSKSNVGSDFIDRHNIFSQAIFSHLFSLIQLRQNTAANTAFLKASCLRSAKLPTFSVSSFSLILPKVKEDDHNRRKKRSMLWKYLRKVVGQTS